MDTIRECNIYPHRIQLTARDQYNDYSVIADHTLQIFNVQTAEVRSWEVGASKAKAVAAYNHLVAAVYQKMAQAA